MWVLTMEPNQNPYLVLVLLAAAAVVFALTPLLAAWAWARFFSPQKPGQDKNDTYECGLKSSGDAWIHFRSEYYLYGIIFLVFDVEIVFLFPWAVLFQKMAWGGFASMLGFLGILAFGWLYLYKRGALEWE